ncbi:MAG: 4Fe-4S dicluster domain-containing protein [Candidatus Omnitrophota bacterium]
MPKIKIDIVKCKGCYLCLANCPSGLIKIAKKMNAKGVKPAEFTKGKCTGCTMCALICPECAIEVYK